MVSEELLLDLYHRTLATTARDFATDLTDTLLQHLPPQDILVLGINRPSLPNVYGAILVPTLQSRGYNPTFHSVETTDNGTGLKEIPPKSLLRQKPVLYVDVHFSPRLGLYLPFILEQNVDRALYSAPIPPPSSLWEYTNGRIVRLEKSV